MSGTIPDNGVRKPGRRKLTEAGPKEVNTKNTEGGISELLEEGLGCVSSWGD